MLKGRAFNFSLNNPQCSVYNWLLSTPHSWPFMVPFLIISALSNHILVLTFRALFSVVITLCSSLPFTPNYLLNLYISLTISFLFTETLPSMNPNDKHLIMPEEMLEESRHKNCTVFFSGMVKGVAWYLSAFLFIPFLH